MSALNPIAVRLIADTGAFDAAIRQAIEAIERARPWLSRLHLQQQRHRVRLVTRRKQRSSW